MSKSTNLFSLNHYKQHLVTLTETTSLTEIVIHIGQIGLTSVNDVLVVVDAFTQAKQLSDKSESLRLHLSLFNPTTTAVELEDYASALIKILSQFNNEIIIAPIIGCQRVHIQQDIVIDFYLGNMHSLLKSASNISQMIRHWFACSNTLTPSQSDHIYQQDLLWQLGRLSSNNAQFSFYDKPLDTKNNQLTKAIKQLEYTGFLVADFCSESLNDAIALDERNALRQQLQHEFAYQGPLSINVKQQAQHPKSIGIIGGGIASACLALSLIERGQHVVLYCKDNAIADGASGNKQGAIYPLLTPENGPLSQFFQHAFLYSRQRVNHLINLGHNISHDFCGVLQTGFDDKTTTRLNKIINGYQWPRNIAYAVDAKAASELAGVEINTAAFYYPAGGWICPYEFANACLAQAKASGNIEIRMNCKIDAIQSNADQWQLYSASLSNDNQAKLVGQHAKLVVANGAQLTEFEQTTSIPLSGFRGQVSHVPSQGELSQLKTVICANGYLTPANNGQHCVGASYIKNPQNLDFSLEEQHQNSLKMRQSFPNSQWPDDIDTSHNEARVGIRMVSRDHFPVMGICPDMAELNHRYQQQLESKDKPSLWQSYWQQTPAPIHQGLFVLGGFGSRGLSSAPIVAESLAAQMCGEILPISLLTQTLLSPNRMWMRKLLKGKAI
ncbi:FAD-dependent 5-carboxymethylaminomethyl-2-thiouridine(34) oxidoreductase MnmC [Shewanella gaetbuli]